MSVQPTSETDSPGVPDPFLGRISDDAREMLLAGSVAYDVEPGGGILDNAEARAGVVDAGLARTYLTARDGRQVTIRYVRAGVVIANVSGLSGERAATQIEAITRCRVVEFNVPTLFRLIRSDPAVSAAIVIEQSRGLDDLYATLAATAFGSIRERIAHHLLERAVEDPTRGTLVAAATQQDLADAIGTSREVVARSLRELRVEGLIATGRGGVEIHDPARLAVFVGRWRTASRLYDGEVALGVDGFLDASPNPIVAVDHRGMITYANPRATAAFGWSRVELQGSPIERLVPERMLARHPGLVAEFLEAPVARPIGLGHELTARRRDGSEFPVMISVAPFESPGGPLILATIVDLSDREASRESADSLPAVAEPIRTI